MSVPVSLLTKLKTGTPDNDILSVPITPSKAAFPVAVASVVLSNALSSPVKPITVNDFAWGSTH